MMRSLKLVIMGILLSALCWVGLAMAGTPPGCNSTGLDQTVLPSDGKFCVGETIEYAIRLAIPPPSGGISICDLSDVQVKFWRPDDTPSNPHNVCESTGGVVVASELYIAQGGPAIVLTSADHRALSYVVREEDIQPDGSLNAYMCVRGLQLVDPEPQRVQGSVTIVNYTYQPCIEVTEVVDCPYSMVGEEIVYEICIANCGDNMLTNLVVTDGILGDVSYYFPTTLPPGDWVCASLPYVVEPEDGPIIGNGVVVEAVDDCGGAVTAQALSGIVTLLYPDFSVTKTCLTDPVEIGEVALFDVVIENTCDIPLNFTTNEPEIPEVNIPPGGTFTATVARPVPPDESVVCNEVEVRATIPSEYCELDWEESRFAEDCCTVECEPCVVIMTDVDCSFSKVGDGVVYIICVENCGDIELIDMVVTDTKLGDLSPHFPDVLLPGQVECIDFLYEMQPGDEPGPVLNQTTVEAVAVCGDMTETVTAMSSLEVTLLHPDFTVTMACLSEPVEIYDEAEFEVTIGNSGDVDLDFQTDNAAITPFSLHPGEVFTQVLAESPAVPPVICSAIEVVATIPQGYCSLPNEIVRNAIACCQVSCAPCVDITKEVNCEYSTLGEEVVYTICIGNCGEYEDVTDIVVTDTKLGDLSAAFPSELVLYGRRICREFSYTIQPGDEPGPVVNQATVEGVVDCGGSSEPVSATSPPVEVVLLHPDFRVTKTCAAEPVPVGENAVFDVTIENTGDVELDIATNEAAIPPFRLAAGEVRTESLEEGPASPPTVCNEIEVRAAIPPEYCTAPDIDAETAGDCCEVLGEGCRSSFWDNNPGLWCSSYTPENLVGDLFSVPLELSDLGDDALQEALEYRSGPFLMPDEPDKGTRFDGAAADRDLFVMQAARDLVRHAVAALLNACHEDIAYPMSEADVIAGVNGALATLDRYTMNGFKNTLCDYNNSSCPLSGGSGSNPDDVQLGDGLDNPDPLGADRVDGQPDIGRPLELQVSGSPNPTGGSVTIKYVVPFESRVTVEIFDAQGRSVIPLVNREVPGGLHTVVWHGTDLMGNQAVPGIYFCRVECCEGSQIVSKVIKVR